MSKMKYKKGFICGFFDLIHDGHIDILRQAKEQCEYLIVGVGTDEFMKERKGRNSVLTYEQRCTVVKAIRYVDEVVPEEDLDKLAAWKKYQFDVMFAGDDHLKELIYIDATKRLKENGVSTIYIPRRLNISSTKLREKVLKIQKQK